jgi:hypothetical protein
VEECVLGITSQNLVSRKSSGPFPLGPHTYALENAQLTSLPELKFVVVAVYTNYTTTIIDDEDIEQLDSYSLGPKGDKLILQFEKVR